MNPQAEVVNMCKTCHAFSRSPALIAKVQTAEQQLPQPLSVVPCSPDIVIPSTKQLSSRSREQIQARMKRPQRKACTGKSKGTRQGFAQISPQTLAVAQNRLRAVGEVSGRLTSDVMVMYFTAKNTKKNSLRDENLIKTLGDPYIATNSTRSND